MIDGINYNGVCRAAPGLAQVCLGKGKKKKGKLSTFCG